LAEGCFPAEAPAAVGAGEEARWKGHRVDKSEGGVVGRERKELLPEALLGLPEVGRLPDEGGPVYLAEDGEPLGVMPAEEEVDVLVGVHPEELSDELNSEHLSIRELGGGSAASEAAPFEPVVHEAEDGHDEGAKIQEKTSVLFGAIRLTPSVGRSSLSLKSSKKLAHGVN